MCGIAGIYNSASDMAPSVQQLSKMIAQLAHRGPDGFGIYSEEKIGFAHARLSIIDLQTGSQPVHNEDRTIWVIFNGEIFNYIELRTELVNKGHRFYTESDTEVIVHLYEQYGEKFVDYLNGQFAIALWDAKQKKLLLVRDRVGIHPLYYYQEHGKLFFASEIKAILAVCQKIPALNVVALDQLMTFWSPVSPLTMFENIYEVSPGEIVLIKGSEIVKSKYWDWSFPEHDKYRDNEEELVEELHDLLIDATRLRLRSDVPVGAYLSGGLDSSVIVSIIHHHGGVPLRTFSIGFDDKNYDESKYQAELIKHLNTNHSHIQCSNNDIADHFMDTIWHTESTILRTAPVPMNRLSGLVHNQGYKVVLTGEGADEVLGGYDIFKETKIRQFWAKNPNSELRPLLLRRLYPYLDITRGQGQTYVRKFFGAALDQPNISFFSHIPRWNTTAKCKEFFSDELKDRLVDNAYETIEKSFPSSLTNWHPFNRAQYIEAKSLMAGYLLCSQGDRMLMSNSVEGRFPFLDHRVIEFANRIHPKLKMKGLKEKYLLKKAMGRYLPRSITQRYKQPYRAPDIPTFFGNNQPEYVDELLSEGKVKHYGYFDAEKVRRLVKKIQLGRAIGYKDNMALVGILSTQIWHYLFVENIDRNIKSKKSLNIEKMN